MDLLYMSGQALHNGDPIAIMGFAAIFIIVMVGIQNAKTD